MSKKKQVTCEDCYFHCAGLCALSPPTPCPTFRTAKAGALSPPHQPRLVPRPTVVLAAR